MYYTANSKIKIYTSKQVVEAAELPFGPYILNDCMREIGMLQIGNIPSSDSIQRGLLILEEGTRNRYSSQLYPRLMFTEAGLRFIKEKKQEFIKMNEEYKSGIRN